MPSALNGVMFQAFRYFLPRDANLWSFLAAEADHLRDIGIDAVWIPPPGKGSYGTASVG
jgi:alpha-amylase